MPMSEARRYQQLRGHLSLNDATEAVGGHMNVPTRVRMKRVSCVR
jgi:hypothetical protein